MVVLPPVDNSALLARLQRSLVGRMFHLGGRSIEALVSLLPKENIWDVEGRVRGVSLGDSRFQFFFEAEADLLKILNKRPCHFNKWSFALERWQPHIGITFPATMTFWIKLEGIPSEFWVEELLRNFGNSFGTVNSVDTTNGRLHISVQADAPLRFNKPAQLPTGEIVKVKLFYEKLYRWCTHCRRICHEIDSCPLLDEEQRAALVSAIDSKSNTQFTVMRGASSAGDKRKDSERLAIAPASRVRSDREQRLSKFKAQRLLHGHGSDVPRSSRHQDQSASRNHPTHHKASYKGKDVDDGRKRRFDESFGPDPIRGSLRRGRGGYSRRDLSPSHHGKEVRRDEKRLASTSVVSDSQVTISEPLLNPQKAKQGNVSSAHVSDRPFRLNLVRKLSAEEKGKGREIISSAQNLCDSSETGSSAKKALNFDVQVPVPEEAPLMNPVVSSPCGGHKEKKKSWFEITEEEEEKERNEDPEAFLAKQFSQSISFASPGDALRSKASAPSLHDAEKDWIGTSNAVSEALNLDWTAEDQEAYNALDSPRFSDDENGVDEDDDVLGEELEELEVETQARQAGVSLSRSEEAPQSLNVSAQVKQLSDRLKSSIVVASGSGPEGEPSLKDLGLIRPKAKKKEAKKKEAQVRHSPLSSAILINSASKKIHNIKGRSPSKRISLRSGPPRSRSSRRIASVPKSEVFPSSKTKASGSGVSSVGPSNPPDTNK